MADPYALPPTAPPWRVLEERVAKLEGMIKILDEQKREEIAVLEDAAEQQRAVNEALLAWVEPRFIEEAGTVEQRGVTLIAALRKALT